MTADVQENRHEVELALRSLTQLPPFTPVLNRLLASLGDEDVSFTEITALIEKDAVITGQVLRLVNSAAYGRRGEITSVRHGVAMLGTNKIRNCVMGLSISRLWARQQMPEFWSHKRFNLHAVAVAILADLIAQRLTLSFGEGAFVAGILHDVGKLLMAITFPEEQRRIFRLRQTTDKPLIECEQAVLGISHPELAAAALKRWNLPVPIQDAVRYHHGDAPDGDAGALARVIEAADACVRESGITVYQQQEEYTARKSGRELLTALGLEDHEWKLLNEFQKDFEAIRTFF